MSGSTPKNYFWWGSDDDAAEGLVKLLENHERRLKTLEESHK